jgi:hypothetical protein
MWLCVGNVDQGCEFALNLRRHGSHLVSKSQIERQVRSQFPVVLGVEPYECLSKAMLRELVWQAGVEAVGVILEKGAERPEPGERKPWPYDSRVRWGAGVVLEPIP